jgi:hypothetical protein
MSFVIYMLLNYPFSTYACRKLWQHFTKVGGASKWSTAPVSEARSKTHGVKSKYEQCTRDQGLQCRLQTSMDAAEEDVRLVVVHSNNMNKVNETQQGQNQCRMSDVSARMTLRETVVNNMDLPFLDNEETCPADAKTIIRTMAGSDTQAELLGVEALVTQHFRLIEDQYNAVADGAHDRAVYDYKYFVGVSVDIPKSFIIEVDGLNLSLNDTFNGLNVDLLGGFQVFLDSVTVRIADFMVPIQNQLRNVAELYGKALATIQNLIDEYNRLRDVLVILNKGAFLALFLLHSCYASFVLP